MPCYHPLKAIQCGVTDAGKCKLLFLDEADLMAHPQYADEIILIPCGSCIGCRLEYSRQWANRCMLELQDHDSAYFVTLTYNDEHVPINYYADPETGEAFPSQTLCKRDLQLFLKRVRRRFSDDKIRFFACGEYGPSTMRPHYHMILFGLHLDDLRVACKTELGYQYLESERLSGAWTDDYGNSKGFVNIGNVSWETCAYVARYITKKFKGKLGNFYSDHNIVPEFSQMSRRPGIARGYYDSHQDIYDFEYIHVSTPTGGLKFRPPRYFDELFDIENPERMKIIKESRQRIAKEKMKYQSEQTDLSVDEILAVQEQNLTEKIKKLRRDKV